MSNEFKPGHPIVFWVMIVFLTFLFFSGAKAMVTLDACGENNADKTWQVWPPEWECK